MGAQHSRRLTGAIKVHVGNVGKLTDGIIGKFLLVGLYVFHAQLLHIVDGCGQTVRGNIIGRAGLKLQRRALEGSLRPADVLYHLAPALIRGKPFQPFLLAIQHADARWAVHFMAAQHKEVAVDILHVNRKMRSALCSVNHNGNAMCVGNGSHLPYGVHRSQHVAHVSHTYEARVFVEKRLESRHIEHAFVVHRDNLQPYSPAGCLQLPGHNVTVMLDG